MQWGEYLLKAKISGCNGTKKNSLIFVCIISAVLLVLLSVVIKRYDLLDSVFSNDIDISFEIYSDNCRQKISLWEDENEGVYYCFLPSYSDLNDVYINAPKKLSIDGKPVRKTEGIKRLNNIELDKKYSFKIKSKEYHVVFMKSANIATMCINTKSGSMNEVHKNKENKEPICMTLFDENGNADYVSTDYSDKIKGRGQSSWLTEKKPYAIELKNSDSLIKGCYSTKWVLLADYYDHSHLRNSIIYDLANKTGNIWNPKTRYVDLFLNGEYAGLYLLAEKIEVNDNKLSLNKDDVLFYLELSNRVKTLAVKDLFPDFSGSSVSAELIYPENIHSDDFSDVEKRVRSIFDMLEKRKISEEDFDKYIDVESFAWLYLIQEITDNCDSGRISLYFYLRNGKLYAGSIWDYDNTLGAVEYITSDILFAKNTPFWKNIVKYETFKQAVYRMYLEKFSTELDMLENNILHRARIINSSVKCDSMRWRYDNSGEVEKLCDFTSKRLDFLNSIFVDGNKYFTICVDTVTNNQNHSNAYFSVKKGTTWESISEKTGLNGDAKFVCYDTLTEREIKPTGMILSDTTVIISTNVAPERLEIYLTLLAFAVIGALFVLLVLLLLVEIKRIKKRK